MQCLPVQTRKVNPPKDNIYEVFDEYLPRLLEKDILLISSKIVGIHQGRCVKRTDIKKNELAQKEAQFVLKDSNPLITIINNMICIAAGIDPYSGHFVLLPKDPNTQAEEFRSYLCQKYSFSQFGVIISDSHSLPLRRGLMNYAVGFAGISPLSDARPKSDFSRSTTNVVDSITAYAGLYMGESSQMHKYTPMVIIRGADKVEFCNDRIDDKFYTERENDMYYPLYKHFSKKNI